MLRYLQRIKYYGLLFGAGEAHLVRLYGYSDLDFARFKLDRKSVSGYVFLLNEAVVLYVFRKQTLVAVSTTKAEYVAIVTAIKEGVWLQRLLRFTMLKEWKEPLVLKADNMEAFYLAINEARNLNDRI